MIFVVMSACIVLTFVAMWAFTEGANKPLGWVLVAVIGLLVLVGRALPDEVSPDDPCAGVTGRFGDCVE